MAEELRCDWCNGPIEGNESSIPTNRGDYHLVCARELIAELEDAINYG